MRVRRCARARNPDRRRRLATNFVRSLPKPGCAARSPGFLFFCPAGGIGDTRMSQKHDVPGSNPGWGTRFTEAPLRHCDRIKRIVLLQLGMWQVQGRHSSTGRARRCQRRDVSSRLTGCPNRFRRLRVRTAAFQAVNAGSTPAGNATGTSLNGQSIRLASEAYGFESHRLHQFTRCSAAASAPRSGRGGRRFESFLRDHTPVAQWMSETLRTSRSRVRILPGVPISKTL